MCAAGALRGSPASTTTTRRRARARTRAADRPAAPPPITTTSYSFMAPACAVRPESTTIVAIPGNRASEMTPMSDDAHDRGGPRPGGPAAATASATQRGVTLTDLAERTGISKSTLSRLENGQRRPSLELLLPLAQAYRVPLDDLVGAPEVGDPRIRLKPQQVNGRTVLPLTRQPNGVQAWKIVIPARPVDAAAPHARRLRVALRAVGTDASGPRRPGPGARGRGGGRVRHPAAALVRQHGRGPGRGAEHLRPTRRADARPRHLATRRVRRGDTGSTAGGVGTLLADQALRAPVTRGLVDRPRLSDDLLRAGRGRR